MVKRQLRNFQTGSTEQMKLVFICAQRVSIRWFLFNTSFKAINAQVPNMLPLEGIRIMYYRLAHRNTTTNVKEKTSNIISPIRREPEPGFGYGVDII